MVGDMLASTSEHEACRSEDYFLFRDTRNVSSPFHLAPCPTMSAPKLASSTKPNNQTLVGTHFEMKRRKDKLEGRRGRVSNGWQTPRPYYGTAWLHPGCFEDGLCPDKQSGRFCSLTHPPVIIFSTTVLQHQPMFLVTKPYIVFCHRYEYVYIIYEQKKT